MFLAQEYLNAHMLFELADTESMDHSMRMSIQCPSGEKKGKPHGGDY